MVTVTDKTTRFKESQKKICAPFQLDESLCLYSPQDNVDSLNNPRVAEWLNFVTKEYKPKLPKARKRVLLFLPCTKTKPYIFSTEHKRINQRLIEKGFAPAGKAVQLPKEIRDRLEPEFSPDVLHLGPLLHPDGIAIHRVVISEPLAFVPYDHMTQFNGGQSPSVSYDDPGLFEGRGNAVSPWRSDSTAIRISDTRWRWSDQERLSYVEMHNVMARAIADAINRLGDVYTHRIAWVAPGLTHRSFVLSERERSEHKVPQHKKAFNDRHKLIGANDLLDSSQQIKALPLRQQCDDARSRLAKRLKRDISRVNAVYSRGGGGATPLALPELLDVLIDEIINS